MSDAAPEAVQVKAKEREGFGRNQIIAVAFPAMILAMALCLVVLGKLGASEWMGMAQWLVGISVVSVNGGSAAVKVAQALRG